MLAWIDLEATGLVATEHAVLEVAAIVTDDSLQEVGRFHRVVYWPQAKLFALLGADSTEEQFAHAATLMQIDPVVIDLHAKNGLWAEVAVSTHVLADVDDQLADLLGKLSVGQDAQKAQIAGSSIWLDRAFMTVSLPRALRQLHYRCLDVTSLNECARRFWPQLYLGLPHKREIHRAMPDIEDSLALCRYYAGQHWGV
jgi:oligoribonuclease